MSHAIRFPESARRTLTLLPLPLLAGFASAQTSILTHPNQFRPEAELVTFEGVTAPVAEQYAAQGVHFQLTTGGGAGLVVDPIPRAFGPSGNTALDNFPTGSCPCADLEIIFDEPMNRIGFEIRNADDQDLVLTISCVYSGVVIDSLTFDTGLDYSLVGLESLVGFDHVLVDVTGADQGRFVLDNLRFETFVECYPTIVGEGFETGDFTGWSTLGPAGIVTSSIGTAPAAGRYAALLATEAFDEAVGTPAPAAQVESFLGLPSGWLSSVNAAPFEGAAMRRTLEIGAGQTIGFRAQFLTNEDTPSFSSNDFGIYTVTCGDAVLFADTFLEGFGPSVTGYTEQTYFLPYRVTFAEPTTVCLGFAVMNALDGERDSALLVDCVPVHGELTPNGEPTCSVDLSAAREAFLEVAPASFVVTAGEMFHVTFLATDPESEPLTMTAEGLPPGAHVWPPSGSATDTADLVWTPQPQDEPGGPYTMTVTFTDASLASTSCSVTVADVNLPPVCDAGGGAAGEITVESTGPEGAFVSLHGTAADPDGDALFYHWDVSDLGVVLTDADTPDPSGVFPVGVTMVTLSVADGRGGVCTDDVLVTVQDAQPPEVLCTTDLAALWPPAHDMRSVQVEVLARDVCADPDAVVPIVVTVRSDEPDDADGFGDGRTRGDVDGQDGHGAPVDVTWHLTPDPGMPGRYVGTIQLRAERNGTGDGRSYIIDATATDSAGNASTTSCVVVVPHDRRRG